MNYWTELSIEYANQRSYLDDVFQVYPTIPEGIREINNGKYVIGEAKFLTDFGGHQNAQFNDAISMI